MVVAPYMSLIADSFPKEEFEPSCWCRWRICCCCCWLMAPNKVRLSVRPFSDSWKLLTYPLSHRTIVIISKTTHT